MEKRLASKKPLYFFLTGGDGKGKTYRTKIMFKEMIQFYDNKIDSDLIKPKGIIVASTGIYAFNASVVQEHPHLKMLKMLKFGFLSSFVFFDVNKVIFYH
jgi:hypothetical protein